MIKLKNLLLEYEDFRPGQTVKILNSGQNTKLAGKTGKIIQRAIPWAGESYMPLYFVKIDGVSRDKPINPHSYQSLPTAAKANDVHVIALRNLRR